MRGYSTVSLKWRPPANSRNCSRVTEKSPYVLVVLQEVERMNTLLQEIRRSLIELQLGLQGALNMSAGMETLLQNLFSAKVPPTWTKAAYASLKSLVPV